MSQINSFRDLIVYQKAYDVSKEIFEISKEYPNEEKYSLTDQIRRSSRSVCANISEAWAKKIYIKALCKQAMHSVAEGFHSAFSAKQSREKKAIH